MYGKAIFFQEYFRNRDSKLQYEVLFIFKKNKAWILF